MHDDRSDRTACRRFVLHLRRSTLGAASLLALLGAILVPLTDPPAAGADAFGSVDTVVPFLEAAAGLTVGADGNLWFANGSGSLGRMTSDGATHLFSGFTGTPSDLTTGPDGNVWFTTGTAVGRVTPAGVVSTFTHADVTQPDRITAGPDGNLWFTSIGGTKRIFRITPAGAITGFSIPPPLGFGPTRGAVGIATGPDGNLWFSTGSNAIGRITPAGVVTVFDFPRESADESPPTMRANGGIVAGPDGQLWFTLSHGTTGRNDAIGRVTTGGALSWFDLGSRPSPHDLRFGPAGALWITSDNDCVVRRMDRDGLLLESVTELDLVANCRLGSLASTATSVWTMARFNSSHARAVRMDGSGAATMFSGSADNQWDITTGPDGDMWSTGSDLITRTTAGGASTAFSDPSLRGPRAITAGPDGNVWFTADSTTDAVGRISGAGAITTFTDPAILSPNAITAGPDGNVWFTNGSGAATVGRITPTGTLTTFGLPGTGIFSLTGIAAGPDGNLWVTSLTNKIARITPAGVVTAFQDSDIVSANAIAAGPDGNLWFSRGTGGIGRITTSGDVTVFTDPTVSIPGEIVAGPDGAMWFLNRGTDTVGRVTVGGQISAHDDARFADLAGLAGGPDGNIWIADRGTDAILTLGTGLSDSVPSAPRDLAAQPGDGSVGLTWTAPASTGGPPISSYTVTASPDGATCSTTGSLTCNVVGLSPGQPYTFVVTATNAVGTSPPSTATGAVIPVLGPPGPPSAVTAEAGSGAAAVAWNAPATTGGAPITGYTVTAAPGGATCAAAPVPRTCTVTGLANGTPYSFTVTATNSAGEGPPSEPSLLAKPRDGASFQPLSPVRVLDSRPESSIGAYSTPWSPNTTREVAVAGVGGVPLDAVAVVLNVTVTGATAASFLSIWPAGDPKPDPLVSSLNWSAGQTIPNAVTTMVGAGGKVEVFNPSGDVHVIVDVAGYYAEDAPYRFGPLTPIRALDSRGGLETVGPYNTPWGAGETRDVPMDGTGGVPHDAVAVALNVTVTSTTASSFLSIWPAGQPAPVPMVSSLNWSAGQTIPNAVTTKIGANGKIAIFNPSGEVHVIIDVTGYYTAGGGDRFHPLAPTRIQDSRPQAPQVGPYGTPWDQNLTRPVQAVSTTSGVPDHASTVVLNTTVTSTTRQSFLTVSPAGTFTPLVSSLNWTPGLTVANGVTAKIGASGQINVYNSVGLVDVIMDVTGWFG